MSVSICECLLGNMFGMSGCFGWECFAKLTKVILCGPIEKVGVERLGAGMGTYRLKVYRYRTQDVDFVYSFWL